MASERPRSGMGLVLGAGGVLGAAWMTGALAALQARLPRPVGDADVMVGTSAGSVLAAALRCGFSVDEIVAHQRGGPAGTLSVLGSPDLGCGALPPWPRPGMGSPRLLIAGLRAPHRVHPFVTISACLPQGRADHAMLRAMVQGMTSQADQDGPAAPTVWPPGGTGRQRAADAPPGWAAGGQTWVVVVDYDSGQRVVFGRPGAPRASLPDAVAASCSIPGWFRPTTIAGRRYIDAGIQSAASADLLARAGLDEVYVLAPTASLVNVRPHTPLEGAEQLIRRWTTFALRREVGLLRSAGTKVTLLTPGPEDLRAMGGNLMDPARRQTVFETSLRTSAESVDHAAAGTRARPGRGGPTPGGPTRAPPDRAVLAALGGAWPVVPAGRGGRSASKPRDQPGRPLRSAAAWSMSRRRQSAVVGQVPGDVVAAQVRPEIVEDGDAQRPAAAGPSLVRSPCHPPGTWDRARAPGLFGCMTLARNGIGRRPRTDGQSLPSQALPALAPLR